MVFIPRWQKYRDKKPAGPVDVDWSNPLSAGLVISCHDFSAELVNGHALAPVGAVNQGDDLKFSANNQYVRIGPNGDNFPTSEISIAMGYQKTDAVNRNSVAFSIDDSNLTRRCVCYLPYSDGTLYFEYGGQAYGTNAMSIGGLAYGDDHWCLQSSVINSEMRVYQNGVSKGSIASSSARSLSANPLVLGGAPTYFAGQTDLALYKYLHIFNRRLIADEVRALYENPYQIWKPTRRFFAVSAGGGAQSAGAYMRRRCMPHDYLQGL